MRNEKLDLIGWGPIVVWVLLMWIIPENIYYSFAEQSPFFRMFIIYGLGISLFIWGLNSTNSRPILSLIGVIITVCYIILTLSVVASYTYTGPHDFTLWETIFLGFWLIGGNLGFFGVGDIIRRCILDEF